MNGSRKPNRLMPTGAKNEEGRPQGQPSSEHCPFVSSSKFMKLKCHWLKWALPVSL